VAVLNYIGEEKTLEYMDQIGRASIFTRRVGAFFLMLTLAGCTAWSDERQKHYSWLYEKCMRGEHEPYTIHMNRNHNSPLPQRCRDEYSHYVGVIKRAL
jgi:hypothetical protein